MKFITVGADVSVDEELRHLMEENGYEIVAEAPDRDVAATLLERGDADCVLVDASSFQQILDKARTADELARHVESLKAVNRAKAVLMRRGLTEEEAFTQLQKASMNKRIPMREIAEAILVCETVV